MDGVGVDVLLGAALEVQRLEREGPATVGELQELHDPGVAGRRLDRRRAEPGVLDAVDVALHEVGLGLRDHAVAERHALRPEINHRKSGLGQLATEAGGVQVDAGEVALQIVRFDPGPA